MRIELEHVTKRFGPVVALDDVTLAIGRRRKVALVGPNGSGKSTLIRARLGLVAVEGRVRLDGHAPLADRVELMKRVAYVPRLGCTSALRCMKLFASAPRCEGPRGSR